MFPRARRSHGGRNTRARVQIKVGGAGKAHNNELKSRGLTGVGPEMGLQALLPGEDAVAVGALDARGRRAALHHEVGERVRPGPAAPVRLRGGPVAGGARTLRPRLRALPGVAAAAPASAVLRRGAGAAGAEVDVARLLAPVPRVVGRVAHGWAAHRQLARRLAVALRRVQLHAAAAAAKPPRGWCSAIGTAQGRCETGDSPPGTHEVAHCWGIVLSHMH